MNQGDPCSRSAGSFTEFSSFFPLSMSCSVFSVDLHRARKCCLQMRHVSDRLRQQVGKVRLAHHLLDAV